MSDGKQWLSTPATGRIRFSHLRRACEGHINVSVVGLAEERAEQSERLAAWLNHIAPDGVIPPVPNDKDGKHE